jgi:hypothetical protein
VSARHGARTPLALAAVAALALALVTTAAPRSARAQEALADYEPGSREWNGLYTFTRTAAGLGLDVLPVSSLEWGDLDEGDILVLLYPLQRVDPSVLAAFVQAGGHVLVADDFGAAGDALARLGLLRADVGTPQATSYYRSRLYAPIAGSLAPGHPLVKGVTEVVTNHPAVLTEVKGATPVIGFADHGAIVVTGEHGTGRFVVVSDPSIFINRMLQFPGNLTLAVNILRYLDRDGRADRVVLLRGDVPMYGEPRPFIDDAGMGAFGRSVAGVNRWLEQRNDWLLTPTAMRVIGGLLALALAVLALAAVPPWRKLPLDGRWLRLIRPERPADLPQIVAAHDHGKARNFLLPAAVLRDSAAAALARATGATDPLYQLSERELLEQVTRARGPEAAAALARCYRRLRGLPSRSQAAAPWSRGRISRRELHELHADVDDLYRKLGAEPEPGQPGPA